MTCQSGWPLIQDTIIFFFLQNLCNREHSDTENAQSMMNSGKNNLLVVLFVVLGNGRLRYHHDSAVAAFGFHPPILRPSVLQSTQTTTRRTFQHRPSYLFDSSNNNDNIKQIDEYEGEDLKPDLESDSDANAEGKKFSFRQLQEQFLPSFQKLPLNQQDNILRSVKDAQNFLDEKTDGWALSTADLSPETERSPLGISFLATNVGYGLVGILLTLRGDVFLGLLTEVTAIASFNYHYWQLVASRKQDAEASETVRLALLIDYTLAFSTIAVALVYTVTSAELPLDGLLAGGIAVLFLGLCWIWEKGQIYMIFHSLWHIFSALAGYLIGASHS